MKILLTLLLIFPLLSFSQIEIKKTSRFTIGEIKSTRAKLLGIVENNDTSYQLIYDNLEYTRISDVQIVSFKGAATLDTLYGIMKSAFANPADLDFKLGDTLVMIRVKKNMGVTSITFFGKSGFTYITEKQLDKLFGK